MNTSMRILLIEDAPDVIHLVSSVLEDEGGYTLAVASDGEEGLAAIREERPAVVLLDMSIPKISGWDLAPRLRADYPDLPIIALTAHAMRGDRERAIERGCTDYISKPFEIDTLLDILERYRVSSE